MIDRREVHKQMGKAFRFPMGALHGTHLSPNKLLDILVEPQSTSHRFGNSHTFHRRRLPPNVRQNDANVCLRETGCDGASACLSPTCDWLPVLFISRQVFWPASTSKIEECQMAGKDPTVRTLDISKPSSWISWGPFFVLSQTVMKPMKLLTAANQWPTSVNTCGFDISRPSGSIVSSSSQ